MVIDPQGDLMRKHGDGPRQVEVCTHGGRALTEGCKDQRPDVWEQPLVQVLEVGTAIDQQVP